MSHATVSAASASGWQSLLSAAAAVSQPAAAHSADASPTSTASAACFQRLYRDALQSIFSFLSADELWSTRRVCRAWCGAAHAERKRRLLALQTQVISLIESDAAVSSAWKELCACDPVSSAPSLQSDVLSMLMRCVSGQPLTTSSTQPASESQLVAALKLVGPSARDSASRRMRGEQRTVRGDRKAHPWSLCCTATPLSDLCSRVVVRDRAR